MNFPRHACSLTLTHNGHKDYYETIEEWEESKNKSGEVSWVNEEERTKAFAHGDVWEIQWYPRTPIGFYSLAASSLDILLAAAVKVQEEEDNQK